MRNNITETTQEEALGAAEAETLQLLGALGRLLEKFSEALDDFRGQLNQLKDGAPDRIGQPKVKPEPRPTHDPSVPTLSPAVARRREGGSCDSSLREAPVTTASDELVAVTRRAKTLRRVDEAAAFLREYLADGDWHALPALRDEAKRRGLSRNAVYRARERLPIQSRLSGFPARAVWKLEGPRQL